MECLALPRAFYFEPDTFVLDAALAARIAAPVRSQSPNRGRANRAGIVTDLRSRGVEVEGVITLASGVRRAFFKDPDGNIIGLRQIFIGGLEVLLQQL